MLEIVKKKKVVKIGDDIYEMKSPTYNDSLNYQQEIENCNQDSAKLSEVLFAYLEKLGMPQNVAKELEVEDVLNIVKYVSGEKKT